VLCELVWVLQRCYRVDRSRVGSILEQILLTRELRVQSLYTVWLALRDYREGPADFADYLVARINLQEGCAETLTFDVDASKAPGMRLLS